MFPWLHPTVVHFAVALIFTAVLLDVVGLWRQRERLVMAGYYNTLLGAAGALVALVTGYLARSRLVSHEGLGGSLLPFHETFAIAATVLAVVLAAARVAMGGYVRPKARTLYLAGAFACTLLLLTTGAIGGSLVYAYGVGISPDTARRVLAAEPPPTVQTDTP